MEKNTTVEVNGRQQNFESKKDCKDYIKSNGIKEGKIFIEYPLNHYTQISVSDFMKN